jgi:hypothetical protein
MKARDELAGRRVKCGKCGTSIVVPASDLPVAIPVEVPVAVAVVAAQSTPAPTAAVRPCPFCAEVINVEARKCKHCGETLDPAMRAAEEARRASQRREPVREFDHEPARRKQSRERSRSGFRLASCGGCLAVLLLFCLVGVVVSVVIRHQQQNALDEAKKLWDAGQRDAAIPKYKDGYPAAGNAKGEVLQRIVDYEADKGNMQEARKWIEKGLDEKLNVAYEGQSQQVFSAVKRERDELEAKKRAEADALVQKKAELKRTADADAARKSEDEFDSNGLVFLVKSTQANHNDVGLTVTGTVINRRNKTLTYVQIIFNLYDESGAQVGTALANTNNLEAGGRWNFTAVGASPEARTCKVSSLSGR